MIAGKMLAMVLLVTAWESAAAQSMSYPLAKEGKPLTSIVVQADADPIVMSAAADLAACIEKVSGRL